MASVAGRRVAVVGGTGFIGSHLVERLVAEGADVLAIARTTARLRHLESVNADCTVAIADVCDAASLRHVFRRWRPEVVFHLAAHPDANESFDHMAHGVRVNGLGLVNALQAAAAAGVEVFVYGDSAKDYGNAAVPYRAAQVASPVCSYAIVKAAGWQLCQLVASFTNLNVVSLRPTFVYGPRQNRNVITYVQECATAGRPIRLMGGSQTRDPLYIDDAVRAFVAAATEPRAWGHAIPIGGGQELTVISLCEAVIGALGANAPVIAGAEQARLTEIWRSSSDNLDAFRLLEWEPHVTLSEGLARTTADWIAGPPPVAQRPVSAAPGCFVATDPSGVAFRLVDRREFPDRRAMAHAGRRVCDAAAAAVDASLLAAIRRVDVPALVMAGAGREETQ